MRSLVRAALVVADFAFAGAALLRREMQVCALVDHSGHCPTTMYHERAGWAIADLRRMPPLTHAAGRCGSGLGGTGNARLGGTG